jgi:hypothetical protein
MKNLRTLLTVALFLGLLGLSGCLQPGAESSRGKLDVQAPNARPSPLPVPNEAEEEAERIEEVVEEKTGEKIVESVPDREMSRQELEELSARIREEERAKEEKRREEEKAAQAKAEAEAKETAAKTAREKPSEQPRPAPSTEPTSTWPTRSRKPKPVEEKRTDKNTERKPEQKTEKKVESPAEKKPTSTEVKPSVEKPRPAEKSSVEKKPQVPAEPQLPRPSETAGRKPKLSDMDDVGIEVEDESRSENYVGPKTAVFRPHITGDRQLSQIAAKLATMGKSDYKKTQKDSIGTQYSACNFFVITALLGANVVDESRIPMFTAAAFPKKYLEPKGWEKIDALTLKEWFVAGYAFDVIIQRDPPKGKKHGHIAIPVGLNQSGDLLVAEGVLGKVTNRVRVYSDKELAKYRIYVRR